MPEQVLLGYVKGLLQSPAPIEDHRRSLQILVEACEKPQLLSDTTYLIYWEIANRWVSTDKASWDTYKGRRTYIRIISPQRP